MIKLVFNKRVILSFSFCLLFLILFSGSVFAQQMEVNKNNLQSVGKISGTVKDKATGEGLPFANILVKGTTRGTTTNADGYFVINGLTEDAVLIIHYVGYADVEIKVEKSMFVSNFQIEMIATSNQLDEVKVTSTKGGVVLGNRNSISTIKMTPKKLEQLPNIGEKDILRSFQLMPGVSASNESSSGLFVRGGTPDQNLVLYDGFTVYHVDHLYGFYSAFNANALKDVQLYKGGFESRFGGRLSSVTEITSKDGNQKKFNIGADVSLLSFNAFAEIPIGKKFSSVIAFRKSYKGPLYNSIFGMFNSTSSEGAKSGESGSTTVASYFYDLNAKFTYRPTDKDIVSLSIYNGADDLNNSQASKEVAVTGSSTTFSTSSTDLTNYGNTGSSLKWSRKWSDKLYGNTIISYSNYFSDRDESQQKSLTNLGVTTVSSRGILETNDLKDFSFKSDYQYDLKNNIQLQFGGYTTKYDIQYDYVQDATISVISKDNKAWLSGGYMQGKIDLANNKLHFLPGLRSSYFTTTNKMYFEPRASATYDLNDNVTLKAATGLYYQYANRITREDILSGSRDFWLLSGTESIPVSSSTHFILGAQYENNNYLFSVEGYYKNLSNLSEYTFRFNTANGTNGLTYDESFYTGKGFSQGIEFLAQRKVGKLNGWISYTLGQAKNLFPVYSDNYFSASQDVTHELKAVAMYKLKRWNFSATWVYGTGKPYTAPSGAYPVTLLDGTVQNYFTVTEKNGQRLPAYHRMDLAANYSIFGGRDKREIGYIGLSLFNVYDRTNVWYKQYSITEGQILSTNVNYLGFTPNLTLSFKLN